MMLMRTAFVHRPALSDAIFLRVALTRQDSAFTQDKKRRFREQAHERPRPAAEKRTTPPDSVKPIQHTLRQL